MGWSDLIGTLASAAGGGILGLLGSGLGAVLKFFQARQAQSFEREKWGHELKLLELEHSRGREEDEHELSLIAQQGTWSGLQGSIKASVTSAPSYKWVTAIKELYRPILTTGLVVIAFWIFQDLMGLLESGAGDSALGGVLSAQKARGLLEYTITSLVFAASTAIVWWFGDRAFAPPGSKNR